MIPISAQTGKGVDRLIPEIIGKFDKWNRKCVLLDLALEMGSFRIQTSSLNAWFEEMASVERLARFSSNAMKRIKFISQTKTRPPTFCLRVSQRTAFTNVEKKTFMNALRESFDFQGKQMWFRSRKCLLGVPLRVIVKHNTSWDVSRKLIIAKQSQKSVSAA